MPLLLTEFNKSYIREMSQDALPNEAGGLFIKTDRGINAYTCKNVSDRPDKHYIANSFEVNKLKERGKIIGYWHSHPAFDHQFSMPDKYFAEKLGIDSVLYCVDIDSFCEYQPIGFEIPYIDRPFYLGVFDCLSLVIDYYERELNIKIPYLFTDLAFKYENWETSPENKQETTLCRDYLIKNSFLEVEKPGKHDILLITFGRMLTPVHFAIYLGGNQILHQPLNSFSETCLYNNYYKNRTKGIFRKI